jgi:iron complex transport system substrate-binding protein
MAVLLALAMLAGFITGCSNSDSPTNTGKSTEAEFTPFTFTDMDGHEVTISKPVEPVYITGMTPLPAIYYYYRGSTEGLVAIPQDSRDRISKSVFADIFADLLDVPSDNANNGGEANAESILQTNPDIVFITGGYPESYKALTDAGLTVVAFTTAMTSDCNALSTIDKWLDQMATVFGDTHRSAALTQENTDVLAKITGITDNIAEADKPKAMIIFGCSNNTLTVAGGGHYSDFWLTSTGAINAAAELNKIQSVNIEQIMQWDPDIIYITNFNAATPDDLYNNTFDGFDWSEVKAVKNKQVYKIPLGSYRWYAPSLEGTLLLKWMASINQPELFADMDVREEFNNFFSEFYDWNLTDEQFALMLHTENS